MIRICVVTALLATALGCSETHSLSPTAPTGPLVVDPGSSATQPQASVIRVQMRAHVTRGLDSLTRATANGAALAEVCLDGACQGTNLVHGWREGECSMAPLVPAGDTTLGVAMAFLDGEDLGIDFCVGAVPEERIFESRFSDAVTWSNVVRTICIRSDVGVTCGSG